MRERDERRRNGGGRDFEVRRVRGALWPGDARARLVVEALPAEGALMELEGGPRRGPAALVGGSMAPCGMERHDRATGTCAGSRPSVPVRVAR